MGFILDGVTIRRPNGVTETNSSQIAENRTLSGNVSRDIFGSNKRIWQMSYENCNPTDYAAIKAIHTSYLANKVAKSWQVTETNLTIAATTVHVDLLTRDFKVPGSTYLSDFVLILKEA
jgi:hypothetical protein